MSTDYSDLQAWEQILRYQLKSGISLFQGPPGLLEKIIAQPLSSEQLV